MRTGLRERAVPEPPVAFRPAARAVLRSGPFQIFLLGLTLLWFGLSMLNLSLALIVTVLMALPRGAVGTVLAASIAFTLLSFPAIARLARRTGKRRALLVTMTMAASLVPFIGIIGLLPLGIPAAWQGYVVIALAGPPIAGLFVLPNAILADIAEDHARTTGHRSEGMFFALQGLIFNGTTSLAAVVLGLLLERWGYAPENSLGLRIVPGVAAVSVVLGALVFTRFPERAGPPSR